MAKADKPSKPDKGGFASPQDVTCTVEGDALEVTWAPVVGASHYRLAIDADYTMGGMAFSTSYDQYESTTPSVTIPLEALQVDGMVLQSVKLKVRASKEPGLKGSNRGDWSAPCVVAME